MATEGRWRALIAPIIRCRLGQIRCDLFEIEEGATHLELISRKLSVATSRVLFGVLKHNTSLKVVSILGCGIDAEGAKALEMALSTNTSITLIDLSGNKIHTSSEGIQALTRAVERNKRLEKMILDGPGSDLIFKEMRVAAHLNMNGKRLRLLSGAVMGALVTPNLNLTDLNLENNECLGPVGANAIAIALTQRQSTLKFLNLSECGLARCGCAPALLHAHVGRA